MATAICPGAAPVVSRSQRASWAWPAPPWGKDRSARTEPSAPIRHTWWLFELQSMPTNQENRDVMVVSSFRGKPLEESSAAVIFAQAYTGCSMARSFYRAFHHGQ